MGMAVDCYPSRCQPVIIPSLTPRYYPRARYVTLFVTRAVANIHPFVRTYKGPPDICCAQFRCPSPVSCGILQHTSYNL